MRKTRLLWILPLALMVSLFACDGGSATSPVKVPLKARTDGPLTVMVVGDTMLDDLALPYIKKYGYEYPLAGVKELLLASDIVNANLETAVTDECRRAKKKKFAYFMKPEGLTALKGAGINVVALANNHVFDCGEKGLETSLRHLDEAGIAWYGAGFGDMRHRGIVVDVKGTKVGFMGWYSSRQEVGAGGTAHMTEEAVQKDIAILKRAADVVIVTFHWGKNYKSKIGKKQVRFGRLAVDAGADAVIGHHPHIPQPMESYKGRPIVYSVGNFAFATGNNRAAEALAARLTIDKKKISRLELIPLVVKNRHDRVRWQTRLATGSRAEKILGPIIAKSKARGAALTLDGNTATMAF